MPLSVSAPQRSKPVIVQRQAAAEWREALHVVWKARWRVLQFQLLFFLVVGVVISLAVSWLLDSLIKSAGTAAVTNYDLAAFFFTPRGFAFLAIVSGAWAASYFLERSGLLILLADAEHPTPPAESLYHSLRQIWPLVQLGWMVALILLVIALPFVAIGFLIAKQLLGAQDINYYLFHQPREWWLALACGAVLLIGFGGIAAVFLVRCSFATQLILFTKMRPSAALRLSWTQTKGKGLRLAFILAGWLLMMNLAVIAISAALVLLATVCLAATSSHPLASMLVVLSFGGLLAMVNAAGHNVGQAGESLLSNRLFCDAQESGAAIVPRYATLPKHWSYRAVVGVALVASVIGLAIAGWQALKSSVQDEFTITAHRAGAGRAPENTLAALRLAIEEQADLAEIDVQTTSDGHLVILHDGDLARIGSDGRRVQNLTFDEIRQIDIGSWHKASFSAERVATLAEMVQTARGKIRLNVELKYNRPDPALAGKVIDLLRAEKILDQCVITSLDYAAIREAKRLAPEVKVGLIVTKAIGDPTAVEADFLSLNKEAVTSRLIYRAHAKGKEIHVWTVNDRKAMEHMIELGADSLITDFPAEAAALRRERAALSAPELLLLRLRNLLLNR